MDDGILRYPDSERSGWHNVTPLADKALGWPPVHGKADRAIIAMTLVGWRFDPVEGCIGRYALWSPVGEYMGWVEGGLGYAALAAEVLWEREDQRMWTGRRD